MSRARPATCSWWFALPLGALALVPVGCDQPTGSTRPRSNAPAVVGVDVGGDVPPAAPAAPAEPLQPRPILGRRTRDIRDPTVEAKAGGVETTPRITARDPITLSGNAYVTIIGQSSILNIQHTLDLYQATNGEYPKTREEFMEKIIKENNIALPVLPFYQEYGYDVPNHKLIILQYDDRKTQANYPR